MTAYDADALATRVEEAKFQQTKFREGYDQDDVDIFLDEVTGALRRERPAAEIVTLIADAKFQPTKFRAGYDQDEIDDFLDEITACVGGTAGQPAPRPEAPKVIEEYPKRSFLGRLFG